MLWLAGLGLRITLLAVPPVLPLIHRDLGLSESAVAVLANLPVLMLAGSSIFGSLLVARQGARVALIAGLVLISVSSAFRGAGHSVVKPNRHQAFSTARPSSCASQTIALAEIERPAPSDPARLPVEALTLTDPGSRPRMAAMV